MQAFSELLSAGVASASTPYYFTGAAFNVSVTALPGASSTVTIQITSDPIQEVRADPDSANWIEWSEGAVATDTSMALIGGATAVRAVAAGAAAGSARVTGING